MSLSCAPWPGSVSPRQLGGADVEPHALFPNLYVVHRGMEWVSNACGEYQTNIRKTTSESWQTRQSWPLYWVWYTAAQYAHLTEAVPLYRGLCEMAQGVKGLSSS